MATSRPRPEMAAIVRLTTDDKPGDVRTERMRLTPEVAAQWLQQYTYDNQRAVRAKRVEHIKEMIQKGIFDLSEIRICYVGERGYLTNGQHRMHAVIQMGVSVDVIVTRRFCSTMEEVALDYATHDARPAIRSYSDIYQAHDLDEETGLTPAQVRILASAAAYVAANFHQMDVTRSAEARVDLVRSWAPAGRAFFQAISPGSAGMKKKLSTGAVLGVALATFHYCPDKAEPFWSRIASNDRLEPGTPEHSIYRWLDENIITASVYNRVTRSVAAAWNAYHDGRPLTLIKVPNPTASVVIRGTPFAK